MAAAACMARGLPGASPIKRTVLELVTSKLMHICSLGGLPAFAGEPTTGGMLAGMQWLRARAASSGASQGVLEGVVC